MEQNIQQSSDSTILCRPKPTATALLFKAALKPLKSQYDSKKTESLCSNGNKVASKEKSISYGNVNGANKEPFLITEIENQVNTSKNVSCNFPSWQSSFVEETDPSQSIASCTSPEFIPPPTLSSSLLEWYQQSDSVLSISSLGLHTSSECHQEQDMQSSLYIPPPTPCWGLAGQYQEESKHFSDYIPPPSLPLREADWYNSGNDISAGSISPYIMNSQGSSITDLTEMSHSSSFLHKVNTALLRELSFEDCDTTMSENWDPQTSPAALVTDRSRHSALFQDYQPGIPRLPFPDESHNHFSNTKVELSSTRTSLENRFSVDSLKYIQSSEKDKSATSSEGYGSTHESLTDLSTPGDLSASPSSLENFLSLSHTSCDSCESQEVSYKKKEQSAQFVPLPDYMRMEQLVTFKSKNGFIDAHCHLDFLFKRQNFEGTHSEYRELHKDTYPESFDGCIAVFCNPLTFPKKLLWSKHLSQYNVWGTFGCHPHHAEHYSDRLEMFLKEALSHPKVRALGEIGLDYSNRNNCLKAVQHQVFKRQLRIALSKKLPLVIHCRDANEDCMNIMKEIIPEDYKIHLHCFTDEWAWAEKWMAAFPNLFIGITNLVTYRSAKPTHDVAKRIPLHRLLLETDAPYFVPRKCPRGTKWSHPGMAIHVAAQIASLRGVQLEEVLFWTRRNSETMYNV